MESNKKPIFIATGTGIAPIKSILDDLEESAMTQKDFCNSKKDQYDLYLDILKEYKNLNINYIPVLSRPKNNWFE